MDYSDSSLKPGMIDEGQWEEIREATQRGRLISQETFQKQALGMKRYTLGGQMLAGLPFLRI
jgi:hypothetical protein